MTRTYAAKRLLEHGPLTGSEFLEITGWPSESAWSALRSLVETGIAVRYYEAGTHRYIYRLAA